MFKLRKSAHVRAIHAACRKLGMDDTERKEMQLQLVGKDSLSAMTLDELDTVLDHLNRGRPAYPGRPATVDRVPLLTKIEALLADMGLPWSYADRIGENVTGGKRDPAAIQRLAWIKRDDHLVAIVAALDKRHRKQVTEARAVLAQALEARGIDDGTAWCRAQIDRGAVAHRSAFPWDATLATLAALTAFARAPR